MTCVLKGVVVSTSLMQGASARGVSGSHCMQLSGRCARTRTRGGQLAAARASQSAPAHHPRAFLIDRQLLWAADSLGAGRRPTTDIPTTCVPFHFH
jgi:hypothetical protein